MEHRAAILVGQKLAAAQLLYGDAVEGALVQQADSGRGFLADLARSVMDGAQVADLNHFFRQVSAGNGNRDGNAAFIGAAMPATSEEAVEMTRGIEAAMGEPSALAIPPSTRQMALF